MRWPSASKGNALPKAARAIAISLPGALVWALLVLQSHAMRRVKHVVAVCSNARAAEARAAHAQEKNARKCSMTASGASSAR